MRCRSCGTEGTDLVLDLGTQHLSDFRDDDTRPPRYPLRLARCRHCQLVQLDTTVPRDLLYHDRYGFYSGVNETIRADLHDVTRHAHRFIPNPHAWLDIASNDGTLLSFVEDGVYRVGVDPVTKFRDPALRHADTVIPTYFDPDLFGQIRFDVVTSVSVFYDLEDPNSFAAGVRKILHPDGVWVIQQNYLLAMLSQTSFDTICHEHLTYWALGPLRELLADHDLEVLEVTTGPVNGGSFRTIVGHRGVRTPGPSVAAQLVREQHAGLATAVPYAAFASRTWKAVAALSDLTKRAQSAGETIDLYAASTRGAVIWQTAGLDQRTVRQAVERNPDKVGRRYSAIGVPIVSEETMRADPPDWLLVGPWWNRRQFIERERALLAGGTRMVFPLPELEVVGA